MQLLIDSTQETPASLRFIAATLCALADTYGPPIESLLTEAQQPSINGPQSPIVLHTHAPAAPIDAIPASERANLYAGVIHQNVIDPARMDPAVVFGRSVPAGTPAAPLAPPAPTAPNTTNVVPLVASPAFVAPAPPVPLMTPPAVSAVTTTAADTPSVAPAVANTRASDIAAVGTASERDSDGLPWDARVHSETRKTNADGTWRNRRNLDATVKAAVMAELRAAFPKLVNTGQMSLAPAAPMAPPPPAAEAPPAPVAPQPPTAPVPVPDGVPVGLPVAPQPGVLPTLGFRDFMSAVNKALAANKLTQDQLAQACKAENLDGITALAGEPMKISLVHARIATLL